MERERSESVRNVSRSARKNPSVAEAIMWSHLRGGKIGFKFRREHPVGPYRLDFYCPEALLAVEMDGEQHDAESDALRDAYLAELGISVVRFKNRRLFGLDNETYLDEVGIIIKLCEERTGRKAFE